MLYMLLYSSRFSKEEIETRSKRKLPQKYPSQYSNSSDLRKRRRTGSCQGRSRDPS